MVWIRILELILLQRSFTPVSVLSERFAAAATYHFYQLLPSLSALRDFIFHKACKGELHGKCAEWAEALASADYIDIDYDAISQVVTTKLYRSRSSEGDQWNEQIGKDDGSKTEVGVLSPTLSTDPEKLTVGGFLVVVG